MSALAAAGTRRILITGGTKGGLGHEAARQLLQAGHEVILTVRDDAKGKEAVDALVNAKGGAPRDKLHYIKMDLGSFDSVKAAGAEVVQKFAPLDAVLLNAGLCEAGTAGPKQTKDGFETTYQVNHLSHFLFVHTILPALLGSKAPGGPRIVAVSSDMHRGVKAYPASPSFAHTTMKDVKAANLPWDAFQAYSLAKLCTLWYVYKLSALAKQANVPITIDAVCPGWVPATNLALKEPSFFIKFTKALFHTVLKFMPFAASYKDGSNRLADLTAGKAALGEGSKEGAVVLGSGRYFQSGKFNKSSPDSYDTAKQDELWNLSLQAVGISGDYLTAK